MSASNYEQGMVLVMGITGSGKSYFVNRLKDGAVLEGDTMESCTSDCQIVETRIGETDVAVVDCPGFDDGRIGGKTDTEILSQISELVAMQYQIGMKLWGVVFLQPITDVRFKGSAREVLSLFHELIGDDALSNVVLATTQWSRVTAEDMPTAKSREQQLRDHYWSDMLSKNSVTTRFEGNRASAEGIVAQLIGKDHVVLQLQKELVEEKKSLGKTGAGSLLKPKVDRKLRKSKENLRRLKAELNEGVSNTRRLRILRELSEAENDIAQGESDEAKLGRRVGVDLLDKLRQLDWKAGLRIALNVVGFAVTIVAVVFGGGA